MDKLLVIDDELGPRESLRLLFKNDYDVVCVDSVDEGLKQLKTIKPDVVIMDIQMPKKTGIDGLREIRRLDQEVSVVILTGFSSLHYAQDAVRLDANEYITKPFDADEMREIVYRNARITQFKRQRAKAAYDLEVKKQTLERQVGRRHLMASLLHMSTAGAMRE